MTSQIGRVRRGPRQGCADKRREVIPDTVCCSRRSRSRVHAACRLVSAVSPPPGKTRRMARRAIRGLARAGLPCEGSARPAAGRALDARRLGAGPTDGSRDAESGRDGRRDALLSAALTTHVTTISSNSRTSECSLSYTNVKTLISCCAVRAAPSDVRVWPRTVPRALAAAVRYAVQLAPGLATTGVAAVSAGAASAFFSSTVFSSSFGFSFPALAAAAFSGFCFELRSVAAASSSSPLPSPMSSSSSSADLPMSSPDWPDSKASISFAASASPICSADSSGVFFACQEARPSNRGTL